MQRRMLGKTGIEVTPLGFGAAQIGYLGLSQAEASRLLGAVLDAGIGVIDTAACYKDSEEKIGHAIGGRRADYVLSTKCGHRVEDDDPPEWSAPLIRRSLERSLRRLKTDHVDLLLLHSCTLEQLSNDEMLGALAEARRDGLVRAIGYSGDNAPARAAVEMGILDALEMSVSICDQQGIERVLPGARERGMGVLAKRPIANACWRDLRKYDPFYENYAAPYAKRLKAMGFTPESLGFDGDWSELALRFTLGCDGVHCALIGGRTVEHIEENVRAAGKGPLPEAVERAIREAWTRHDDGSWQGET